MSKIDEKYQDQHEELRQRYYERGEITKEEHDLLHAQLWSNHHQELVNAGLAEPISPPEPTPPTRDLIAEMDDLTARVGKLERR